MKALLDIVDHGFGFLGLFFLGEIINVLAEGREEGLGVGFKIKEVVHEKWEGGAGSEVVGEGGGNILL